MSIEPPKTNRDEPYSLHGMMPEEAIQWTFHGPEPREVFCSHCDQQIAGLTLVDEEGEIRCPKCGLVATYENRLSGAAYGRMGGMAHFSIGDHVQVTETFPHRELRNASGVVIAPPEPGDDGEDLVWVEFDAPMRTPTGTSTAAAGIGVNYLRPV